MFHNIILDLNIFVEPYHTILIHDLYFLFKLKKRFHSRAMVQRTMDKMSPEAGAMFHQIGRGS